MLQSFHSADGYPLGQLLAAAAAMFAHAFALTSLFPYVAYMVVDIGATSDVNRAGYYAGFVGAAFMTGRMFSSYLWGEVADRCGRKPVLLVGLATIAALSVAFGMSQTFEAALITRFLIGLGNGIAGTAKTMVAELCSAEHQPRGMGMITGTWSLGLILGPAIGGLTSRNDFGLPGIFGRYPYLMPNLITAAVALYAFYTTVRFLPETAAHLRKDKARKGSGRKTAARHAGANGRQRGDGDRRGNGQRSPFVAMEIEGRQPTGNGTRSVKGSLTSLMGALAPAGNSYAKLANVDDEEEEVSRDGDENEDALEAALEPPTGDEEEGAAPGGPPEATKTVISAREIFARPLAVAVLVLYFSYCLVVHAFDEILPLWMVASRDKGGYGGNQTTVGIILSITGGVMGVFQVLVYPVLTQFYCPRDLIVATNLLCVPAFAIIPMTTVMGKELGYCALTFSAIVFRIGGSVCFSSIFLVTNAAVEAEGRGRLNGMSMTIGSIAKAMGPLWGSWSFAWSINNANPFGSTFAFFVLGILSVVTAVIAARMIPKLITSL